MGGPSRHGELHYAVARFDLFNVVGLHGDHDLQGIGVGLVHKGVDPEGRDELGGDAVVHHCELSIRWLDLQRSIDVKLACIYSLVEIAVIEHHQPHVRVGLADD